MHAASPLHFTANASTPAAGFARTDLMLPPKGGATRSSRFHVTFSATVGEEASDTFVR